MTSATADLPRFVDGLDAREYRRAPGLSSTGIADLRDCPATYRYFADHPEAREDSDASVFGSLVHAVLLEGEDAAKASYWVAPPGFGTNKTKQFAKECAEWGAAEKRGLKRISPDDFDQARRVRDAVLANPTAREIVTAAEARERSLFWTEGDVPAKARLDIDAVTAYGIIADLKVRDDPSPSAFQRDRRLVSRATQAAFYVRGYEVVSAYADAPASPSFAWIIAPSSPPYTGRVWIAEPDPALVEYGRKEVERAIQTYRECVRNNTWNGYGDAPVVIAAPRWAGGEEA
jgi:hypothetical protein